MSGGRIESERLGLALDRVRERAPRPAVEVKPSDSRPAQAKPVAPEHLETFAKPAERRSANVDFALSPIVRTSESTAFRGFGGSAGENPHDRQGVRIAAPHV